MNTLLCNKPTHALWVVALWLLYNGRVGVQGEQQEAEEADVQPAAEAAQKTVRRSEAHQRLKESNKQRRSLAGGLSCWPGHHMCFM